MSWPTKEHLGAVEMYAAGLSTGQIAKSFDVTRQAMWEWLKARGVRMRPKLRFGKENHFYRGTRADDHAQNVLEKAVLRGAVNRKTKCETCGTSTTFKDGRTAIQAHHPDYNKPFEVMWLCQRCHHEWHRTHKAIPRRGRR